MPSPISKTQFLLHNQANIRKKQEDLFKKFSSGKRVNSPVDDIPGSAKLQNLESSIRGLNVGNNNATAASSLLSTASGGLTQSLSSLQELRSLAVQAADGTLSSTDRQNLTNQASSFIEEINRTANAVEFNGTKLLNGTFSNKAVQVGSEPGQSVSVSIDSATAGALGVNGVDLSTADGAESAITAIDEAIKNVSSSLTSLGSQESGLERTINQNNSTLVNLTQSASNIGDLDYAKATVEMEVLKIKTQTATTVAAIYNRQIKSITPKIS